MRHGQNLHPIAASAAAIAVGTTATAVAASCGGFQAACSSAWARVSCCIAVPGPQAVQLSEQLHLFELHVAPGVCRANDAFRVTYGQS